MKAIVVGGGIVGSATAYHLAVAGVDVELIDRADEGRATAAGAGILSPATSSSAGSGTWFRFAIDAVDYYTELNAALLDAGVEETGYAVPGLVQVAVNEAETRVFDEGLARIRDRQERLGEPKEVHELSPEEARDRSPIVGEVTRALWNPDGGRVDGRTFTAALQAAGERAGLTVREGDVTSIRVEADRVQGVVADGERVDADAVVVAGGAWSPTFSDDLGFEIPIEPMRGQILHLDTGYETGDWPIVTGTRSLYTVPWEEGRIAVGATYEEGSGYAPHSTVEGVHEVLGDTLEVLPGLADAAIGEIRVGLRPASPDGLPICGPVPGVEGAFLATGHGPTGLQMGPYSGRQVARLVRGERVETEMEAFSPARFVG